MAQSEQKEAHPVTHAEDLHSGEAHSKDTVHDAATRGQALTGYETLTPWETAKKFKACAFYVFLAALSAGTDGYQTGFVRDTLLDIFYFILILTTSRVY